MNATTSRFSDLIDSVVSGIVEALTNRESMTEERRDARTRTVREMLLGLCPGDVRQLMVASQAVLAHALSIEVASGQPLGDAGTAQLRLLSAAGNLIRTVTRNLDTLARWQGPAAKTPPASVKQPPALEPAQEVAVSMAEPLPEPAILSEHAVEQASSGAVPEVRAAPSPPLNRKQRRLADQERARLARRAPAGKSVTNAGRGPNGGSAPG
jgi:hypothetical protein